MENLKMIVEITKGSKNKYEIGEDGKIFLDRVIFTPMVYPEEYGMISNTIGEDGDPLDVVCLINEKTFPGCIINIRVVGVLKMIDQGQVDDKIIAVAENDWNFSGVQELSDINKGKLSEIEEFFFNYKKLEKKGIKIIGYYGKEEALSIVKKCSENYKKK